VHRKPPRRSYWCAITIIDRLVPSYRPLKSGARGKAVVIRSHIKAVPAPMPKQRERCGARIRRSDARLHQAASEGRLDEYLRRSRWSCRNWPVRGGKRCRFHGGYSTGPRTADGLARTVAAMIAGRTRWLRKLRVEGSPIPCGRKKGGRNLPLEEREQVAYEKRCHRQAQEVLRQIRAERRARRRS
jgi:hypothetical protein